MCERITVLSLLFCQSVSHFVIQQRIFEDGYLFIFLPYWSSFVGDALLSHGNHLTNNFLLPAVVLLPILSGLLKCWNWSSPLKLAVRWVSLACLASFMKKHLHLSFHNMNYTSTCMRYISTYWYYTNLGFVIASHFVVMLVVHTFGASLIYCL